MVVFVSKEWTPKRHMLKRDRTMFDLEIGVDAFWSGGS